MDQASDLNEALAAAQAAHSNALAAYRASLLEDDPKASEKAQAAVTDAAREVERCEVRLAVAKDREQAKAVKEAEEKKAAGARRLADALKERETAGQRLAWALKTLKETLAKLDALDQQIYGMQKAGHGRKDAVYGHTFGEHATRARLEIELREVITGIAASTRPEPIEQWVSLGCRTLRGA